VKVFIDTNVWVAAYVSQGLCRELLTYVRQRHDAVLSEQVLNEFAAALVKKAGESQAQASVEALVLRRHFPVLPAPARTGKFCRDPKDDAIVQAALDAGCDWLVSGDADLCVLKRVQGMPISTPRNFLQALGVEEEWT
jgi:putative PIN family toxin of toxin-antitoxin system